VIIMDLREIDWGLWGGSSWLRIGTSGGLLWIRWWTFGFRRHGVSIFHFNIHLPSTLLSFKWSLPLRFLSTGLYKFVFLIRGRLLASHTHISPS
jgi:hypothetical protein